MKSKIMGICLCSVLGYGVEGAEEVNLEAINVTGSQYRLDELNRNMYYVDSEMIKNKGYSSVEQVFSYMPFATFSNIGLGSNIDLRGQGSSANVNTQILLNGVGLNMLDSSHGVAPLNSVGVDEIESIEILPGGGAVMYGNGTRGGVVNIITKKRYESLSASVGAGYTYSNGSGAKLNAKVGGKFDGGVYWSLGGGYLFKEGYRQGDKEHLFNLNGGISVDIGNAHSVGADIGYFRGMSDTTPLLRFSEINNPSKSDRDKSGNGVIKSVQDRIYTALNYDYKIDESNKLGFKVYYHYFKPLYEKNLQVMDYAYGRFFLPQTQIFQDGSYFIDQKIGVQTRYDYSHQNGLLIVGFDSVYAMGERKLDFDIKWKGKVCVDWPRPPMNVCVKSYDHTMNTLVDVNKWSNSLWAIEKYDFTSFFSLTAGARYEVATYGGKREFYNDMKIGSGSNGGTDGGSGSVRPSAGGRPGGGSFPRIEPYTLYKPISDIHHNFALEFIPKFSFDAGDAYAKYERGFRSPNPDNLTSRNEGRAENKYIDTNVKSETYDTFELGTKLFAGDYAMFLLTGFYTLTHNEIYTLGSAHSGNGFKVGNFDKTQRAGVELASEQSFLEGVLGFSESVSYVDARVIQSGVAMIKDDSLIPYVSNYKVTLGANYRFYKGWNLWVNSSFVGTQKDTANNTIPAYNLTDIGMDFSYEDFSLSFGVRNVADTFYYSYYNKDKSDEITGYAFLIGEGRSYFVEGRYRF